MPTVEVPKVPETRGPGRTTLGGEMSDLDARPIGPPATPPAGSPPRRHRRWVRWAVAAPVVLLALVGVLVWQAMRPPRPVSVSDVVNKFRSAQPSAHPTGLPPAPAVGVYLYATQGSERISAGNVTHQYPDHTTLTVVAAGCGLRVRWDALSGRWSQAQLCATSEGWRVTTYTDVHKFLYLEDVHSYTCEPPTATGDGWSVVCRWRDGQLTSTMHRLGSEPRTLAGKPVTTTHLRIDQRATGKSLSVGTINAWVLPSGLPVHLDIADHGSQTVLGQHVTYREQASFDLTSATPRR